MESVKVNKNTKDALSELARREARPESAIVADMLATYRLAQFNARVKQAQARPLPTGEQDSAMAEWNRINRLIHEGRADTRNA